MPSQTKSIDFSRLFLNSSKEFFSEIFYDAMNIDSLDLEDYSQKCNTIIVKKSTAWIRVNSGYDISLLLNYWLYKELSGIYGANNTSIICIAFSALQYIWGYPNNVPKNASYHQKCKPELSIVNHQDWDKRKELYDYYVDYDTLFPMAKIYDNECKYYKKIEAKKSLYKPFEKECSPITDNCPHFYEQCKPYNPENVLSLLQCHSEMEKKKASPEPPDLQLPSGQEPESRAPAHVSAVVGFSHGSGTESIQEYSDIGKKFGHSILGVAPVLLTDTALYTYTPVGSWVRRFGGYKSNSLCNMDRAERDGFSSYTQGSGDMFLGDTENYISYQPM
ncbi:PIR Superfamily Protein [Plasmodium ovale curtisi]|uniref:PIR Superfamily Protein n=1 Tax=Plasmodium ovale curtisi TaxID=864141 RepID=A0A1A8WPE4_PLAOA|nr:PIR Superfamily Protein [Plasmodium ovale curtisi]